MVACTHLPFFEKVFDTDIVSSLLVIRMPIVQSFLGELFLPSIEVFNAHFGGGDYSASGGFLSFSAILLVWQDESYQYSLYGSFTSVSELMKIAEGIRIE